MGTYRFKRSAGGFVLTPGYETYEGLGWYGVLVQERQKGSTTRRW
jgi:hypothetical protein